MFVPSLAGQDMTPEFFNASIDDAGWTKYQASDQTRNNNTAYLDSTFLVFPLAASGGYTFNGTFFWSQASGTPDVKFRLTAPTGSFIRICWGDDVLTTEDDLSDVVEDDFLTTAAGLAAIRPSGFVSTDVTAGNLIVAFAQNTAHASNTVFEQGSFLTLRRVL